MPAIRSSSGLKSAGAIPAASIFSEHTSTDVTSGQEWSKAVSAKGLETPIESSRSGQHASRGVMWRSADATKSTTKPPFDDADLDLVIHAWPELP